MTDFARIALITLLTPVVWVLLSRYVIRPLNNRAKRLPTKLAEVLTKRHFED